MREPLGPSQRYLPRDGALKATSILSPKGKRMSTLDALFADKPPESSGGSLQGSVQPSFQPSDTALAMDRWSRRKGDDLAEADWNTASQHEAPILADCHTALFSPSPRLAERPIDVERSAWFKQLLDTPEYHALHNQTCLNDWLSDLCSKTLADQWQGFADKLPEPQQGDPAPGSEGEPIGKLVSRISSTQKAVRECQQEATEAQEAAAAMGAGNGPGEGGTMDSAKLSATFQQIRGNDKLRKIIQMAGRYRRSAAALQRRKVKHGADDVVGVEISDDLERILPDELALLHTGLRLDTMRRIAEGEVFCQQYSGLENVAKGPIVVLVDESGSMEMQDRIITAKALALTMGWVAKHQRRWIAFGSFSGEGQNVHFAMPPHRWDQQVLLDWLSHYFDGGTSLDTLCDALPNVWWPEFIQQGMPAGKTDVLLITDGIVPCSDEMQRGFLAWKKQAKAKCYGIVLESDPGVLTTLCDQHWLVKDLGLSEDAVQAMLGV